ncbi:MAG: hypothetical protein L0Y58_15120 [Verrucomicrobia subdivision 3 bacterium]|nr:hypothetical protein [Limisphaerales bacterium]
MKLPNASRALISQEKITLYLLDPLHPDGGNKARFFLRHGFRAEAWIELASALKRIGEDNDVGEPVETMHGIKYVIDGTMTTPSGRRAKVRTVWIVDRGSESPRFVTAYPI